MESQLVTSIQDHLPVVSTAVLLLLAAFFLPQLFAANPLSKFPLHGVEAGNEEKRRTNFLYNAVQLQAEAYRKFKNIPYRITGQNKTNMLVMPARYLEELKRLPDTILSFREFIKDAMAGEYTDIPFEGSDLLTPHTVRSDLTPALTRINPIISDEVDRTVREEIPASSDWTSININKKLLRIVAIVSGRVFLGPELCREERYISAAIDYTGELMEAVNGVKAIPPKDRKTEAPKLAALKKLKQREDDVVEFLEPVIAARKAAQEAGDEAPDDMLAWLMSKGDKYDVTNIRALAKIQLGLSFAAIHTTTLTATNVFYNLAVYPHYVAGLRQELRDTLAEHDGILTFGALQQLRKLDSFVKETMRMEPIGAYMFSRVVLQNVTLSDGTTIPTGTEIGIPSRAISRDPELFENPDTFDGFRFAEMREADGVNGGKHQFVSSTPESLLWGYGRHACPGRFFAANEIKMIVARVLLNYDMKNADGTMERYKNISFGNAIIPDASKELLMRAATA